MKERYDRQIQLPEVGPKGQAKLCEAHVAVVGCGGLGAPLLLYLAAAGVREFTLFDDDRVEMSNLNRQVLFGPADVGALKVQCAQKAIERLRPDVKINANAFRVSVQDGRDLFSDADCVIDCSDGLPTKFLLNDLCVVKKKTFIHGSATAWAGQAMVVQKDSACLRCLFEGVPPAGTVPTCQEAGVLGATVGIVGAFMAQLTVRALLGEEVSGRFWSIDLRGETRAMTLKRRKECAVCGDVPEIDGTDPEDYRAPRR